MTEKIICKSRLYHNKSEVMALKEHFELQGFNTEIAKHIIDNIKYYQLYLKQDGKDKNKEDEG